MPDTTSAARKSVPTVNGNAHQWHVTQGDSNLNTLWTSASHARSTTMRILCFLNGCPPSRFTLQVYVSECLGCPAISSDTRAPREGSSSPSMKSEIQEHCRMTASRGNVRFRHERNVTVIAEGWVLVASSAGFHEWSRLAILVCQAALDNGSHRLQKTHSLLTLRP